MEYTEIEFTMIAKSIALDVGVLTDWAGFRLARRSLRQGEVTLSDMCAIAITINMPNPGRIRTEVLFELH